MEALRFVIFGLAMGGLFALLAQGMVLVYRGSGLLNFAQGAIALTGGFVYYEVTVRFALDPYLGAVAAIAFCALLGVGIHYGIMRPMRHSSPLQRVIATLGVVMVLQSFAYLFYGFAPLRVPSLFPTEQVGLFGGAVQIGLDRLIIIAVCVVVSVILYLAYRNTAFGRATTAVAENQLAAASLGHSPDRIAAANWAFSSALAGLVGVLIAPIIFLEPATLVLLVIPAMSAALLGGFMSFTVTFATAILLGVSQSLIQLYAPFPGWATAFPFFVIILILVLQGRSLPLRSFVLDRMPSVGSGRLRPIATPVTVFIVAAVILWMNPDWATSTVVTLAMAIIGISVVVITGFTGQLSLAQLTLAGMGALIAARLTMIGVPFIVAMIAGAVLTALIGLVVSIPALRIRGVTLAVVTLGLASAMTALVLLNSGITGGLAGLAVPVPSVFGIDLDPFFHPQRYALFAFIVLVLAAVGVANLRRGQVGRRLLAVRSNERAAASLGVNVSATKSYAFALSAAIASIGGTVLAFSRPAVEFSGFTVFLSIMIVAVTVVGGIGYVGGAIIGSTMMAGGIGSMVFHSWPEVHNFMPLAAGIILLMTLLVAPDGLFELNRKLIVDDIPWRKIFTFGRSARKRATNEVVAAREAVRVAPRSLVVDDLSVSFGGVHAVRNVSITVNPGEVHGIIGPNGAGKTTLIDGITGFVKTSSGTVRVGDAEISKLSARHRARRGVSRSFQSLELFSDLTVRENLAVAGEHPNPLRYFLDLVRPGTVKLSPAAWAAVHSFGLAEFIDERPENISFGHRKAVAIARSVASTPAVLLLDEPAAGLGNAEAAELAELIGVLAREWGIGILLVEHNVDLVLNLSDRVTVIQSGAVMASGTPDEIRSNPAVIDAYLGAAH